MPVRGQRESRRERTRRELLRALLEEEESEAEGAAGPSEADLLLLLRELRGGRRGRTGSAGLISSEHLQGFVWGVGAASLLLMVLPTAKQTLRPFAVSTIKTGLDLVDQLKRALGEAGEGLQDIMAEAQFERMKDAAGPDPVIKKT